MSGPGGYGERFSPSHCFLFHRVGGILSPCRTVRFMRFKSPTYQQERLMQISSKKVLFALLAALSACWGCAEATEWESRDLKVVDPDGDCRCVVRKGEAEISVPGTAHDLSAETGHVNAPRAAVRNGRRLQRAGQDRLPPVAADSHRRRKEAVPGGLAGRDGRRRQLRAARSRGFPREPTTRSTDTPTSSCARISN